MATKKADCICGHSARLHKVRCKYCDCSTYEKRLVELPKAVDHDQRICFGISFFKTEDDAKLYDQFVRRRGTTYHGGFFHGMPCGRDASFDYVHKDHGKLYAVTD